MPQYQLKQKEECFKVVDGPCAGRHYRHGETYDEIPLQEKHRFEKAGHAQSRKGAEKKKDNPKQ